VSVASFISRMLHGEAAERRRAEVERDICAYQADRRNNIQSLQSGARVVQNMSGALRMMVESERESGDE